MRSLRGKKVLITSGPTCVPVDKMRVITNRATGELGQMLAQNLAASGAKVTLLEGPVANPLTNEKISVKKFYFFSDLAALLRSELKKKFDMVIHNAAVSDYRLKAPFKGKLSSDKKGLTLKLVRTGKLINQIKSLAPKTFLVGFKLEDFQNTSQIIAESKKLFASAKCDLVVANTLNGGYSAFIVEPGGKILSTAGSRKHLTLKLIRILEKLP